jgi:hypothetical protein
MAFLTMLAERANTHQHAPRRWLESRLPRQPTPRCAKVEVDQGLTRSLPVQTSATPGVGRRSTFRGSGACRGKRNQRRLVDRDRASVGLPELTDS